MFSSVSFPPLDLARVWLRESPLKSPRVWQVSHRQFSQREPVQIPPARSQSNLSIFKGTHQLQGYSTDAL